MNHSLDAVARGLRLRRNNRELLTDERIQHCRLARIGPAENADETGAKWHREYTTSCLLLATGFSLHHATCTRPPQQSNAVFNLGDARARLRPQTERVGL